VVSVPTSSQVEEHFPRQSHPCDQRVLQYQGLSSVIPDGTAAVACTPGPLSIGGAWGDRLYVVMAEERVQERNVEAWAGLGWVQQAGTGKGLFVEHHGHSEATVRADISASLESLVNGRDELFGPVQMQLSGATCREEAVCALVVAVFGAEPWP